MEADDTSIAGPGTPFPADVEQVGIPNGRQRAFVGWTTDILVYVVVLNVFVEYSAARVIDSFTISILTAVMLKVLLVLVSLGKLRVWSWARSKESSSYAVFGALGVWAILFFSKFLILGAEDLFFGDRVELGSFADVIVLTAALILARELVQRIYLALGGPAFG